MIRVIKFFYYLLLLHWCAKLWMINLRVYLKLIYSKYENPGGRWDKYDAKAEKWRFRYVRVCLKMVSKGYPVLIGQDKLYPNYYDTEL